jgi:hypothetical protein
VQSLQLFSIQLGYFMSNFVSSQVPFMQLHGSLLLFQDPSFALIHPRGSTDFSLDCIGIKRFTFKQKGDRCGDQYMLSKSLVVLR